MRSPRRVVRIWIVMAAVAVITTWPLTAGAADTIATAVAARSLQPGELIVFTSTVSGTPSRIEVTLFGRRAAAFPLVDGRWRALVGIDLEQKPGPYTAVIDATFASGVVHEREAIVVKPKTFATRTLTVSPDFVNPPASQLARIEGDSAFLKEIFAASPDHRLWDRSFLTPVPDPANSRFGTRSIFNGERRNPHGGADFASPLGRPVKAPNGGRVVGARELFYTGNVVIIDHGLGMFSLLAHLSRIDVKEGDEVKAGDVVGLVGATGRVTGPHLHWALTIAGARVDPVSALAVLGEAPPKAAAPGRRARAPR
jgi:murein DD-endopeptidase MepM/ murein hydrolase activator NlpD